MWHNSLNVYGESKKTDTGKLLIMRCGDQFLYIVPPGKDSICINTVRYSPAVSFNSVILVIVNKSEISCRALVFRTFSNTEFHTLK